MEPVGLAVGLVGLAGLFSTCLDVIEKVEAFKDFRTDSQTLFTQYEAFKLMFTQWGRQVGIRDGDLEADHHSALDDPETATVVNKILSSIQTVFDKTETVFPELRSSGKATAQIKSATNDRDEELSSHLPSKRGKLRWAIKGKATFLARVQQFGTLVQTLYSLVPLHEGKKFTLNDEAEQELYNDLKSKAFCFSDIEKVLAEVEAQIEEPEKKRETLDSWLSASWTTDLYDNFVRRRLDNTCAWIFERPDFCSWISAEFPSAAAKVFWINGVPGSGKTILCASIIQRLLEKSELLAYHFISSDSKSRDDSSIVLRAWISQIVSRSQEARELAYAMLDERVNTTQSATQSEIESLFQAILQAIPRCTFIVDGLDEYAWASNGQGSGRDNSPASLLKAIKQASANTSTRLLIVSRDEPEIRQGIYSREGGALVTTHEYKISQDDVKADITSFSKSIVDTKLVNKSENFRDGLSDQIADRCHGMFIWVKMLGDELRGGKSERSLQNIVSGTPTGLSTVYDKNWDKICSLPEDDRARAFSILRWTTFALRPLTIEELTEALLINDDGDMDIDDYPDTIDEVYVNTEILGICGSLVEVRQMGSLQELASMTLQPIHFSARQHIMINLPFSGLIMNHRLHGSSIPAQHDVLAISCLKYINTDSVWQKTESNRAMNGNHVGNNIRFRFTNYAADAWNRHIRIAGPESNDTIQLVNQFFGDSSKKGNWRSWGRWIDVNRRRIPPSRVSTSNQVHYLLWLNFLETAAYLIEGGTCDVNYSSEFKVSALHIAASKGYTDIAKLLISKGAVVKARDYQGWTPLFLACSHGHVDVVRLLLSYDVDLEVASNTGSTPLYAASARGHDEILRLLLSLGAKSTCRVNRGWTPLHAAAENGHIETVKILLEHGISINAVTNEVMTPLHSAARFGRLETIRLLLEKGAVLNAKSKTSLTPLMLAAIYGHQATIELLLTHGADIDAVDSFYKTPLIHASANGFVEIVKLLLAKGAGFGVSPNGWSALMFAARGGHAEIVVMLLEAGSNIDAADMNGYTLLNTAGEEGRTDVVKLLLERNPGLATTSNVGWTPLQNAIAGGHLETVKLLLEKGADIAVPTKNNCTPIHNAADEGYLEIVQLLLEKGADFTVPNNDGWTPLNSAADRGHTDIVRLLVEKGADFTTPTTNGWTPLNNAADQGHYEIVRLLLDKGADHTIGNSDGVTPLINAASSDYVEIVMLLLERGADINQNQARGGLSALLAAAEEDNVDIVTRLLESDIIDVNASDVTGRSPLFYAATQDSEGVVKRLCQDPRVDIDAGDRYGVTPFSVAARRGFVNVTKHFLATGKVRIDNKDCFGRTPLWYARKYEDNTVAQLLIDAMDEQGILQTSSDVPNEVGKREVSPAWCDVCGLDVGSNTYHECAPCGVGTYEFVVCSECYEAGWRCLQESHELKMVTPEDILD